MHQGSELSDKGLPTLGGGFPAGPPMSSSAFGAGGGLGSLMTGSSTRNTSTSSNATGLSQPSSDLVRKPAALVGVGNSSSEATFSSEIEEEANDNFKRLYNRVFTIDHVLDMLRLYKESSDPKQKDVFQCMLRNLFEEYKFFSSYPEKELQITGLLFGGLIEHNLVTYMHLGLALRYVLESLRKPKDHKLYNFGISCLDRFKHRLKEYPQYCGHVAAVPNFASFPQTLRDYVTYGRDGKEPPQADPLSGTDNSSRASFPHIPDTMSHIGQSSVVEGQCVLVLLLEQV